MMILRLFGANNRDALLTRRRARTGPAARFRMSPALEPSRADPTAVAVSPAEAERTR